MSEENILSISISLHGSPSVVFDFYQGTSLSLFLKKITKFFKINECLETKLFEIERNAEVSTHRVLNPSIDHKIVVKEEPIFENVEMPQMLAEREISNQEVTRNSREINLLSLKAKSLKNPIFLLSSTNGPEKGNLS